MLDKAYNFAKSIISPLASGASSVTLTDPSKFVDPASGEYNCTIWCSSLFASPTEDPNVEVVRMTAKAASVYTITRAQEGTSDVDHNSLGEVYSIAIGITAKMITDIDTGINSKVNIDQTTPQTITGGSPAFSEGVDMANDKYLKGKNYAGTEDVNIIKVNTDNEAEVGVTMNTGTIEVEDDAGAVTIIDMGVTSASADGTEMSYVVKIDGNNLLKIYTESDGAGGVDTFKVQLLNKAVLTMEDSAGTTHTYTSDTDGSLIIS